MLTNFSWSHHENLGWTSLIILGAVIGLAIIGILIFFIYLPTRPRRPGWLPRLRKRARQLRFVGRRGAWMDQVGQASGPGGIPPRDRRELARHLSSVYPELRLKAALVLREKGGAEGVCEAQRQLAERGDPRLVAEAIIGAQWREMEPVLLPLIEGKEAVAGSAMAALAEVGGRASLSALLAQEGRPDLAGARERAIVRLRKRLGQQNEGLVSLADSAELAGALGMPKE